MAARDSLHEADMWAVEGLTHRYPTKVLAELIPTCPQYCGHCTRMDLVGNDTLPGPEVQVRDEAERALGRDARLPAQDPERPRRGRLGRRHGERPDQAAPGLALRAVRHRERPRRADRDEGPDGHPAALPAGRRARGLRGDRGARARARGRGRDPHPRERRPAGDPARRIGGSQAAGHGLPRRSEPGGAAARREHRRRTRSSSSASRSWITRRSCPTTSTCAT